MSEGKGAVAAAIAHGEKSDSRPDRAQVQRPLYIARRESPVRSPKVIFVSPITRTDS
jgi:hypothetical protein